MTLKRLSFFHPALTTQSSPPGCEKLPPGLHAQRSHFLNRSALKDPKLSNGGRTRPSRVAILN